MTNREPNPFWDQADREYHADLERERVALYDRFPILRQIVEWEAAHPFPADMTGPMACPRCGERKPDNWQPAHPALRVPYCPTCRSRGQESPMRTVAQLEWVAGRCEVEGKPDEAKFARWVAEGLCASNQEPPQDQPETNSNTVH